MTPLLGHHWHKMPATSQLLQLRRCCLGSNLRGTASGVLQHRQHLVTHRRRQRRQVRLPLPAVREVRLHHSIERPQHPNPTLQHPS